jgi:hypothetical protein
LLQQPEAAGDIDGRRLEGRVTVDAVIPRLVPLALRALPNLERPAVLEFRDALLDREAVEIRLIVDVQERKVAISRPWLLHHKPLCHGAFGLVDAHDPHVRLFGDVARGLFRPDRPIRAGDSLDRKDAAGRAGVAEFVDGLSMVAAGVDARRLDLECGAGRVLECALQVLVQGFPIGRR